MHANVEFERVGLTDVPPASNRTLIHVLSALYQGRRVGWLRTLVPAAAAAAWTRMSPTASWASTSES